MGWKTRAAIVVAVCALLVAAVLTAWTAYHPAHPSGNRAEWIVKVTDKARVSYGLLFQDHKYLIYTVGQDGTPHVFEDTDDPYFGKLNSSDYYAAIERGKCYRVTSVGERDPARSAYPNVIEIELYAACWE